jgi:hypothetical protein
MGYADYPVQTPFGMRYQKMQVEIDEAPPKDSRSDRENFRLLITPACRRFTAR